MVSKQQKEMKKRKTKEKDNQLKLARKRSVRTKQRQEERAEFRREKRIKKLQKEMGELNEAYQDLPDKTLSQLEHNAKILKALEDEYQQETDNRRELNQKLAEQGRKTLDEKLGILGSADYRMTPARRPPKDVADVGVVRGGDSPLQEES